jgi:hypothetical protein
LSRVYRTHSLSSERDKLLKLIVYSISKIPEENEGSDRYKDLTAFIALTSKAVIDSIDTTIKAWEKRGYWIKADKFRDKWSWIYLFFDSLKEIILHEDWHQLSGLFSSIQIYLSDVTVPKRPSFDKPWIGSYDKFINK